MNPGTILFLVIGGFLLLVILFLPLITRSAPKSEPKANEEREKAYRRGLMIGGLMEEMPQGNLEQRVEQAMIDTLVIEHLQQHHPSSDDNKKD